MEENKNLETMEENEIEGTINEDETDDGDLKVILGIGAVGAAVGFVTSRFLVPAGKKAGKKLIGKAVGFFKKKEEPVVEGKIVEEPEDDPEIDDDEEE